MTEETELQPAQKTNSSVLANKQTDSWHCSICQFSWGKHPCYYFWATSVISLWSWGKVHTVGSLELMPACFFISLRNLEGEANGGIMSCEELQSLHVKKKKSFQGFDHERRREMATVCFFFARKSTWCKYLPGRGSGSRLEPKVDVSGEFNQKVTQGWGVDHFERRVIFQMEEQN